MYRILLTLLRQHSTQTILLIMDGSCVVQIFLSRKFTALAHTIHANIYIYRHKHNPHTHHDPSTSVQMPVEKGKFWAGLWSQRGWGDSASWQAANSRQLEQWNWRNGWETQNLWKRAKRKLKRQFSTFPGLFPIYLAEFVWTQQQHHEKIYFVCCHA